MTGKSCRNGFVKSAACALAVTLVTVHRGDGSSPRSKDDSSDCIRLLSEPLIDVPSFSVKANPQGPLIAGAARIDITPPPGFPMGGSAYAATYGRGYWTRLYARAFYFRDAEGQALALVSCDLNAIAGGLQAKVAWLLRDSELGLTRENLILSATHVHHGPGNFMSYKIYNDVASPHSGFDNNLFEELAQRIAHAVRCAGRRAQDFWGWETELVVKRGKVSELLRNRAPVPFLLNPDRDDVVANGPTPIGRCPGPYRSYCPRYRAVDETLSLLEINQTSPDGTQIQAGTLVFLSVHPESMSHDTGLYQSDFTGLAMRLLERGNPNDTFVAGFFNGADGDISVRWKRQNRNEAVFFANRLLGCILSVQSNPTEQINLAPNPKVRVARAEIPANPYFRVEALPSPPTAWCKTWNSNDSLKKLCLAAEPLTGVATIGGAEDARSSMFDLGWKDGVRTEPRDRQGVKVGAFESKMLPGIDMTALIGRPCYYPERFPVSFVGLGTDPNSIGFAAVPAELTRTVWWRIEKRLRKELPTVKAFVPIGLANEYIQYVTTREEYAAQGYEGASVMFGPSTAEVIEETLVDLGLNTHRPIARNALVERALYFPDWPSVHDILTGIDSGEQSFGPDSAGVAHSDPDEALENLIVDEKNLPYRHWPRFEWIEQGIDDWKASRREIRILREDDGIADRDDGPSLLTVFAGPSPEEVKPERLPNRAANRNTIAGFQVRPVKTGEKKRHWFAIWLVPKGIDRTKSYRFSVQLANGTTVRSKLFQPATVEASPTPDVSCEGPHPPCPPAK
jgi:neutral ceramidase